MAVAAVVTVLRFTPRSIGSIRLGLIDLAFVVFVVARVIVEILNASELSHAYFSGTILLPITAYVGFLFARQATLSAEHAVQFLRWFAIPVVGVSLLAIMQVLRAPMAAQFIRDYVSADGYERRLDLGWAVRGTSTIGHHTALGGYLVCITAAVCLDILISRKLTGRLAVPPLILLPVVLIGQVTTLTFATIALSAIIALVTLVMLGLRPILTILVGVAGLATWQLFGAEIEARLDSQTSGSSQELSWLPETIAYRVGIWTTETLPAIGDRPLTGWGIDVYAGASKGWPIYPAQLSWGSPESEYMRTLITGGVIVLLAQIFLFLAVWSLVRATRRSVGTTVSIPFAVLFTGLLLLSAIHSHFANPGVPYPFWIIVGVCAGMVEARRKLTVVGSPDVSSIALARLIERGSGQVAHPVLRRVRTDHKRLPLAT